MNKGNAINNANIKINAIEWYVPQYTPGNSNQAKLAKQILSKTPIELQYVQGSVFMKDVKTQNFLNFELGTQEGNNFPIWIIFGFHRQDRQDSQNLNNDVFSRPPVASTQCIIGTETLILSC